MTGQRRVGDTRRVRGSVPPSLWPRCRLGFRDGGDISPSGGSWGMSAKRGGRWVSFCVSCLACVGTGKMLHPWLYTSPPRLPKPSNEGLFQPWGDREGMKEAWESACRFI